MLIIISPIVFLKSHMNRLKRISNEETYYPFLKDLDEAQTFT